MKNLLYLLMGISLYMLSCSTQSSEVKTVDSTNNNKDSITEMLPDEIGSECVYKKTDKKISTTYPFNEAEYIEIVSYPLRLSAYSNSMLIKDGKFIVERVRERIRLTKEQKDTLFSLLYDHRMRSEGAYVSVADCYTPRHSILFYKQKKPIAFLEVCFDCGGTRKTKEADFGEFCEEKIGLLRNFFLSVGLKKEGFESGYEATDEL